MADNMKYELLADSIKEINVKAGNATKSATPSHQFMTKPELLVNHLSFSHIREIMVIDDAFERFFITGCCIVT